MAKTFYDKNGNELGTFYTKGEVDSLVSSAIVSANSLFQHSIYGTLSGGMLSSNMTIRILVFTTREEAITTYTQLPFSGDYIMTGEYGCGNININKLTGSGNVYLKTGTTFSGAFGTFTISSDNVDQII